MSHDGPAELYWLAEGEVVTPETFDIERWNKPGARRSETFPSFSSALIYMLDATEVRVGLTPWIRVGAEVHSPDRSIHVSLL